jgi:HEAT repeat protein
MRMDNETYRLKVESYFELLYGEGEKMRQDILTEIEKLAMSPRKGRYFLRVVANQKRFAQVYFYRYFMQHARHEDAFTDLERHIRHMFYEDREAAKALLAEVVEETTLSTLFRVISLTEEGWLAGELIRIALTLPSAELYAPIARDLRSNNYLLQCLVIYLIGKTADETLLDLLIDFYRKPEGEKVERLEKKALDAILEGARTIGPSVAKRWLKDKSSRVRAIALVLLAEQMPLDAVTDLVGLFLVDPKTRLSIAKVLLAYEEAGLLSWQPDSPLAQGAKSVMQGAKSGPLVAILRNLMREESPVVRQVAAKLSCLAPASDEVASQLRLLVTEDKVTAVQIAALQALVIVDRIKLLSALVEILAADPPKKDVYDVASAIADELRSDEKKVLEQGISDRLEMRETAMERAVSNVEWWRHDT